MSAIKTVVLSEFNTVSEAEMLCSLLESASIWSMVNNEHMSTSYPMGMIPAQVIIREDDLQRAQELVAE